MSFKTTELCALLVEENYGELPTRIFATLMHHGRLQLRQMVQYSELSPRQVQHGLAVLIRQNLAFWSTDLQFDLTFYEANWLGAYSLVRSGKAVEAAKCRLGDGPGSLFADCLLSGHFKVGNLERAHNLGRTETDGPSMIESASIPSKHLVNGYAGVSPAATLGLNTLHANIYALLEDRFLTPAHEAHFRPEVENYVLAEEAAKERFGEKVKKKDMPKFKAAVQDTLQSWLQGSSSTRSSIKKRSLRVMDQGTKRQFASDSEDQEQDPPSPKKQRLNNGIEKTNGTFTSKERSWSYVGEDIVLTVNINKIAVAARSKKILQLAEERMGLATAEVYAAVLKTLDANIYQCCNTRRNAEADLVKDDGDEPSASTLDVFSAIKNPGALLDSVAKVDGSEVEHDQPQHRKEHRRKSRRNEADLKVSAISNGAREDGEGDDMSLDGDGVTLVEDHDSGEDNVALELARQHLFLLAESPFPFLRHYPGGKSQREAWSVPFRALAEKIRLMELNKRIASQFGSVANRIVHLLQEKGKLDERTIGSKALVPATVTRKALQTLAKAGYIEIQEVPRDNNRQPSRTIWLWFFDADRCGKKMLEDTYQTMSRCLQRLRAEREAVKDVLNNAARTDVVGKEESMLSAEDLADLKAWRSKEERLLGELNRLDDIVLVLRDFPGL